jgi:hypothetical protein
MLQFQKVLQKLGYWVEQEERHNENLLIEQLDDTASVTSVKSVITIEMDETSDCELLASNDDMASSSEDAVYNSFKAIENGIMNLEIRSGGGFEDFNVTEIEEARRRQNYEISSGLQITTTDAEFQAMHQDDDDDTLPYTNKSMFMNKK